MPKSKEFFALLKEQGRINNPKFDELINSIPDFEISPEAQKAFEDSFMTVDRAATHPTVTSQVRALAFKPINRDFEKIIQVVSSIDKATADKLENIYRDSGRPETGPDTYKRMELFSSSLEELFNKVKAAPNGDEELKKKVQKLEQSLQESLEKLTNSEKEHTTFVKQKEKEFEDRLHEIQLDTELEKLSGTFTLAEAFDKNRSAVNKMILSELKGAHHLKLGSKDGQKIIQVFDENGSPRYNGNTPVTINNLLEEKFKPFLKQSNADGNGKQNSQSNTRTITNNGADPLKGRGQSTAVVKKS